MRLLGAERADGRTDKYWLHSDGRGNDQITVETVQDAAPIIKQLKQQVQNERPTRDGMRLKARIPVTMMDEAAKISGKEWGISPREAFAEIVKQKTDRARRVLRLLSEGRDYKKLQAKAYR